MSFSVFSKAMVNSHHYRHHRRKMSEVVIFARRFGVRTPSNFIKTPVGKSSARKALNIPQRLDFIQLSHMYSGFLKTVWGNPARVRIPYPPWIKPCRINML